MLFVMAPCPASLPSLLSLRPFRIAGILLFGPNPLFWGTQGREI